MARILTEQDAVLAYASAWNRLDPELFLKLLAPNATYSSQWVFSDWEGAAAISRYLRDKMDNIRAHGAKDLTVRVQAEVGRTTRGSPDRPCALMTQGHSEVTALVIFEVRDGQIHRFDMCIPALFAPVHSRVFPV